MNIELVTWLYICVGVIIVGTEITLIITLNMLRKEVKRLNGNMNEYFGKMMDKIKAMVDLFLKAQLNKFSGGEIQFNSGNVNADLKLTMKDDKNER